MTSTPVGDVTATNVQAAIAELDTEKAPLASPTFTGVPGGPTAATATNTTQLATTAYVRANRLEMEINSPPTGTILAWAGGGTGVVAPTGYVECDGAAINRTTFARLFAVIGTRYGAGDGSTTFNVPSGVAGQMLSGIPLTQNTRAGSINPNSGAESVGHSHANTANSANESGNHGHPFNVNSGLENANHAHGFNVNSGNVSADHGHAFAANSGNVSADHSHSYNAGNTKSANTSGISANHFHTTSGGTGGINTNHSHNVQGGTGNVNANHAHNVAGTTEGINANHSHAITVTNQANVSTHQHATTLGVVNVTYIIKF
ncbi:tail fiber protein [Gemmatimonas sp.]|uniref:phage tail protein n=1 Tax=Gemmatimonas sp. TaxID=1962908 RepID=UPI0035614C13